MIINKSLTVLLLVLLTTTAQAKGIYTLDRLEIVSKVTVATDEEKTMEKLQVEVVLISGRFHACEALRELRAHKVSIFYSFPDGRHLGSVMVTKQECEK